MSKTTDRQQLLAELDRLKRRYQILKSKNYNDRADRALAAFEVKQKELNVLNSELEEVRRRNHEAELERRRSRCARILTRALHDLDLATTPIKRQCAVVDETDLVQVLIRARDEVEVVLNLKIPEVSGEEVFSLAQRALRRYQRLPNETLSLHPPRHNSKTYSVKLTLRHGEGGPRGRDHKWLTSAVLLLRADVLPLLKVTPLRDPVHPQSPIPSSTSAHHSETSRVAAVRLCPVCGKGGLHPGLHRHQACEHRARKEDEQATEVEERQATMQAEYRALVAATEKKEASCHGKRAASPDRPFRIPEARKAVLLRSKGICENPNCTGQPEDKTDRGLPLLEIDHIEELAGGGRDHPSGMIALCPNCHAIKTRGTTRAQLTATLRVIAEEKHANMLSRQTK